MTAGGALALVQWVKSIAFAYGSRATVLLYEKLHVTCRAGMGQTDHMVCREAPKWTPTQLNTQ